MILLAVDTSTAKGTLAVASYLNQTLKILGEAEWDKQAKHSEVATTELSALLEKTNLKLSDITHILVNHGPGSFTGLRVGINLARTLAYALNLPILPIGTLELLAFANSKKGDRICVAIKALQKYSYVAAYLNRGDCMEVFQEPISIETSDVEDLAKKHGCTLLDKGPAPSFDHLTNAGLLSAAFAAHAARAQFFLWPDVKPLYIRGSEAEEKLRQGILKPL